MNLLSNEKMFQCDFCSLVSFLLLYSINYEINKLVETVWNWDRTNEAIFIEVLMLKEYNLRLCADAQLICKGF